MIDHRFFLWLAHQLLGGKRSIAILTILLLPVFIWQRQPISFRG